jgi:hypothetical protein
MIPRRVNIFVRVMFTTFLNKINLLARTDRNSCGIANRPRTHPALVLGLIFAFRNSSQRLRVREVALSGQSHAVKEGFVPFACVIDQRIPSNEFDNTIEPVARLADPATSGVRRQEKVQSSILPTISATMNP